MNDIGQQMKAACSDQSGHRLWTDSGPRLTGPRMSCAGLRIGNWPIQAVEADIMRLACVLTNRRGVELIGCVHDALVIESSIEKIDEDVAITRECMRRASRIVLNSEHELRTDATIVKYPGRFTDKRGSSMWNEVIGLLDQYHQQQKQKDVAASA